MPNRYLSPEQDISDQVEKSDRTKGSERDQSATNAQTDPVSSFHRAVGNQALQRVYRSSDHNFPDPRRNLPTDSAIESAKREEERGDGYRISSETATQIQQSQGSGQSMDRGVRGKMESKLGTNLDNVRIHTGKNADRLARKVNAEAFTAGQDIYFRRGNYAPEDGRSEELLAHELVHVVSDASSNRRNRYLCRTKDRDDHSSSFQNDQQEQIERAVYIEFDKEIDAEASVFWRDMGEALANGFQQFCTDWQMGAQTFHNQMNKQAKADASNFITNILTAFTNMLPGGDYIRNTIDIVRWIVGLAEGTVPSGKSVAALVYQQISKAQKLKKEFAEVSSLLSQGKTLMQVYSNIPEKVKDDWMTLMRAAEISQGERRSTDEKDRINKRKTQRDKMAGQFKQLPGKDAVTKIMIEQYLDAQKSGVFENPGYVDHEIWINPGEGEDKSLIGLIDQPKWEWSYPTWWDRISDPYGVKNTLERLYSPKEYLHNINCVGINMKIHVTSSFDGLEAGQIIFQKTPNQTGWMESWKVTDIMWGVETTVSKGKGRKKVRKIVEQAPEKVKPQVENIDI